MLTVGSLFRGIGGLDLGFERAGMRVAWSVEIDQQCNHVARRHWPDTPVLLDVCESGAHNLAPVDVIVFGSPCQDLSVAGKRAGLGGERSGLFHEAARIIRELKPRLAVWENVPGAFTSDGGRDFAVVLRALSECGAIDIAWRVLDSQWFGVAQRRRRVFVVADFGGERAGEILALAESLCGHPAPRREAGEGVADDVAPSIRSCGVGVERAGDSRGQDPVVASYWDGGQVSDTLDSSMAAKQQMMPEKRRMAAVVAFQPGNIRRKAGAEPSTESFPTLGADTSGDQHPHVATSATVRRLTPRECERLQGFPDDFTAWGLDADGKQVQLSDSARYRMLGNAVTVNVAEWIGKRIVAELTEGRT